MGDEHILPQSVQDKQIEALKLLRIGPDGAQLADQVGVASRRPWSGLWPIMLDGQLHDRFEVPLEMVHPVVAILNVDQHVFGSAGTIVCRIGQQQKRG